jgi:O-antigen ligase
MRGFVWGSLAAAFLAPDWATGPHESLIGLPSRLAGVTPHPNVLGFLAVAALVLEWSRRPRNAIAVALAFGAIVWTESKTAWAAVVVILLVGLLRRAGLATRTLALVVLSGSFGLTAMIAFTLAAPDRSTVKDENGADTFTGRTAIWEATLEVWQDQPVLGIGPRLWDEEMDRRFAGRVGFPPGHAHSQLVQTLGEAGVAGAASLVVALAALGGLAARAEARTRGATLGLFVLIVVSCFSEPRVRSNAYASGFFLVLGTLALGLAAAPEPSEALDG